MLDERSAKMMSLLTSICADASYKIIQINDLVRAMLPRFTIDVVVLGQIINYLAANELIDVKYADEKVYCIAVLPKGRVLDERQRFEKQVEQHVEHKKHGWFKFAMLFFGCFLAAFLGGLLAGLIC